MAKGEDTAHHPGRKVGRPTPRLVSAMNALYGTSTYGSGVKSMDQSTINHYRNARDEQAVTPPEKHWARYNVPGMQEDIRTALAANRDPEYMDALNDHGQSS